MPYIRLEILKTGKRPNGCPSGVPLYMGWWLCTLSERGTTRFFGAKMTASFVILVVGRQPGGLVCLAGRDFCSRKTPKDLPARKMGAGKEEDEGGLTPTEDDDAASVYFSRRQAYCPLSTEGTVSFCPGTYSECRQRDRARAFSWSAGQAAGRPPPRRGALPWRAPASC